MTDRSQNAIIAFIGGKVMGRSKEFEENVVLRKAMELFWEQGYEKTSMNDLVEHMGIHRRSLYDTFGDKHALYLKAINCYGEYSECKLNSESFRAKTAKQSIRYIFDLMIDGDEEKNWGCFYVNAATEMAHRDKEVEEKMEEAFKKSEYLLAELIRKGQQTGEFTLEYDAQVLAEILHNTLLGIRVLVRTSASKEKVHRITDFFLDLISE